MTFSPFRPFLHAAFPAAALLGSGCVAFNVGKPETFTHVDWIVETAEAPSRTGILSTDARFQKRGNEVAVGLGLELAEDFEKREHSETVNVRKQKRLAVGLFPGAAEFMFVPDGALLPTFKSFGGAGKSTGNPSYRVYHGDPRNNMEAIAGSELMGCALFCIPITLSTLDSLIYAPFDDWRCGGHEFVDPDHVRKIVLSNGLTAYDASDSPKLRSLLRFSNAEQKRIGINTCFYHVNGSIDHGEAGDPTFTHTGLIGMHKHLAVFVDGPTAGPSTVIGTETKRRSAIAGGPFIAELKIPDLGHSDWKRVAAGETQAAFALPAVQRDCTVEAVVSFREDSSINGRGADELTRQALAKAAGREWRFDLVLKGTGLAVSGPVPEPALQPAAPLFEVVEITPKGDGQYFVRVAIKDKSKTFSVIHLIEPEVYRLVRNDFRSKNPGEPAQFVRERMRYETEKDGKILSFTGWVFSVRPVDNGWFYDPNSRRGWVRLRIVGGIPAAEAEDWAHENIAEIVKYKNVAIEAGKAPPPGATFRSLGESFEGGVLTVEFEAVQ